MAIEYRHDFLKRVADTISPQQENQRVFRNLDGDITNKIHSVSYALKGSGGEEPAVSMIPTAAASASVTRTAEWNGVYMTRTA